MRLAARTQSIAPFFAMETSKQANALMAQGHDVIKLNIGEPDFGAAPAVQAAMVAALKAGKTQYTDALGYMLRCGFDGWRRALDFAELAVVVLAGSRLTPVARQRLLGEASRDYGQIGRAHV